MTRYLIMKVEKKTGIHVVWHGIRELDIDQISRKLNYSSPRNEYRQYETGVCYAPSLREMAVLMQRYGAYGDVHAMIDDPDRSISEISEWYIVPIASAIC